MISIDESVVFLWVLCFMELVCFCMFFILVLGLLVNRVWNICELFLLDDLEEYEWGFYISEIFVVFGMDLFLFYVGMGCFFVFEEG